MNSIFRSFFLTPFLFWLSWTGVLSAAEAVLETDTLRYVIGEDGKNISLFDKVGGHEYLEKDSPSFCALAKIGGAEYPADSAEFDGHLLRLSFAEEAITAAIKVTPSGGSLIFETAEVTGEPDELVFVNIPLTLEAKPYEPFAACALALTPFTHVRRFPALHDAYWAEAAARFGLVGAKAALVGVPQPDILPAIRRVMTDEAVDIPGSDRGGAWALSGSDGFGS